MAFSADGGFTPSALFEYLCPGDQEIETAWYAPAQALFRRAEQPAPHLVRIGWKLGSSCFSCPGTKLSISITKEEAVANSRSVQHTLSIAANLNPGIQQGFGGTIGYTASWLKQKSTSLTNGHAHTIEAECNAFNLYYWTITTATWGGGEKEMPTQIFYCTDRKFAPTCVPPLSAEDMATWSGTQTICSGHDVNDDFFTLKPINSRLALGERCDLKHGSTDCEPGLVCQPIAGTASGAHMCVRSAEYWRSLHEEKVTNIIEGHHSDVSGQSQAGLRIFAKLEGS